MKDSRYLNLFAFLMGMLALVTDWNIGTFNKLSILNAFFTGANLVYCIHYFITKEQL